MKIDKKERKKERKILQKPRWTNKNEENKDWLERKKNTAKTPMY